MTTIQERLAQKAAASIATGVANSSNVFGGIESPPQSAVQASVDPVLQLDSAQSEELQANFLQDLSTFYKGPAFYQNSMAQAMMPGGKFLKPDDRGVYVPQNEAQLARLEYFASKGLLTVLETQE